MIHGELRRVAARLMRREVPITPFRPRPWFTRPTPHWPAATKCPGATALTSWRWRRRPCVRSW